MVSEAAARALERIGDESLTEALARIVRDPAAPWCGGAAQFLAGLAADSALPALLLLTRDPRAAVREGAAKGLGIIGSSEAAEALVGLCSDPSEDVRHAAVSRLGQLRHAPAVGPVLRCLERDDSILVRASAAEALGGIGDPTVLDTLCRTLGEPGVGPFAALALGHLGDPKAVPALTAMCRSLRGQAHLLDYPVRALARIGGTAAGGALAELLPHEEVRGRSLIADALGDVSVPAVVGPLAAAIADESVIVRAAAREALRKLSASILVEGLAEALTIPDVRARREAVRLAPYYADEKICRLLADLASREPDPDISAAALRSAEIFKRKAIPVGQAQ